MCFLENKIKYYSFLEGKPVLGPRREIQEVLNIFNVYDHLNRWNRFSDKDHLDLHSIMMKGLLEMTGYYRDGGVAIMDGKIVVHMAPPAERFSELMDTF